MTDRQTDILIFGSGRFAARIAFDIAASAAMPVRVAVAARNRERLAWFRTAANARAVIFGRPAHFTTIVADLAGDSDLLPISWTARGWKIPV